MGDLSIVSWLVIGVAVGVVSKLLYPGRDAGGWLVSSIFGAAGALLDGWGSAHLFGQHHITDQDSWMSALVGAVITVAIYRFVLRRNLML